MESHKKDLQFLISLQTVPHSSSYSTEEKAISCFYTLIAFTVCASQLANTGIVPQYGAQLSLPTPHTPGDIHKVVRAITDSHNETIFIFCPSTPFHLIKVTTSTPWSTVMTLLQPHPPMWLMYPGMAHKMNTSILIMSTCRSMESLIMPKIRRLVCKRMCKESLH